MKSSNGLTFELASPGSGAFAKIDRLLKKL